MKLPVTSYPCSWSIYPIEILLITRKVMFLQLNKMKQINENYSNTIITLIPSPVVILAKMHRKRMISMGTPYKWSIYMTRKVTKMKVTLIQFLCWVLLKNQIDINWQSTQLENFGLDISSWDTGSAIGKWFGCCSEK